MAKPRGSCQPTSGFCPLAGKSRCSSTAAAMRAFLWRESRMKCKSAPLAFCWDALSHLVLKYENYCWGFSLLFCSVCLCLGVNCYCFLPPHTSASLNNQWRPFSAWQYGRCVRGTAFQKVCVRDGVDRLPVTGPVAVLAALPAVPAVLWRTESASFSWERGWSEVLCAAPWVLPLSVVQVCANAGMPAMFSP